MGSVIKKKRTREKCQIFTPSNIVNEMLDHLGYSHDLYGKSILENSCGDGQFLKEIVKRYIIDCENSGLDHEKIRYGLSHDIYGIELDPIQYQKCIEGLNAITDTHNIGRVSWHIKQADALRKPFQQQFDYVVSNPPYISYWDLDLSERKYVAKHFTVCTFGAWDYSYAFLQDGFNHLNQTGRMAYIVPNSIFKTNAGVNVRKLLRPYITEIFDYTITNVFGTVLTSPAVLVVDRSPHSGQIGYHDLSKKTTSMLDRSSLGDIWLFGRKAQTENGSHRFGDYYHVATSIATQCNDAFVLKGWADTGEYLCNGNDRVERAATRKAASPRGKANNTQEYIIFPYYYYRGKLKHYTEDDYKKKFPFAFAYLERQRAKLEKRDADKSAQWFEYGRSQALTHINQKKLLLSTVITDRVRVYKLTNSEIPYSGLFITAIDKKDALPLDTAVSILTSPEFMEEVNACGINARGKSIRIVAKNLLDYRW